MADPPGRRQPQPVVSDDQQRAPPGQTLGIKEFGLALAIAVAVDATLVRCLLVPAP
jgi:hypothetical protein